MESSASNPERALWQAVLLRMIRDLSLGPPPDKPVHPAKIDAERWWRLSRGEVRFVCEMAGLDYEKVIAAFDGGALYEIEATFAAAAQERAMDHLTLAHEARRAGDAKRGS